MRLWIAVATFNRQKITEIVLRQLAKHKADSYLHVTDDYSTDYDERWLKTLGADLVVRPPKKCGIDQIRLQELKTFMSTDYDLCYLTDNDAYHDPAYVSVLKNTYTKFKKPISLYNTNYHRRDYEIIMGDVVIRNNMPGISHLYDRQMVQNILDVIATRYPHGVTEWDCVFPNFAANCTVTTRTSYVQHYGAFGIHSGPNDYYRDTAVNPTKYLIDTWEPILEQLGAIGSDFTYCGMKAQQSRNAMPAFRAFFAEHADIDLVIELGTGYGGFAIFLKDEADKIGAKFVTYEINPARLAAHTHEEFTRRHIDVRTLNVLTPEGKESILAELSASRRALVLCDGGSKKAEFNIFAPHLKPGDILMAHDYAPNEDAFKTEYVNKIWNWHEIDDVSTMAAREAANLVPYYPDFKSSAWLCVIKKT
jgi:cephalosporin hydroxylase